MPPAFPTGGIIRTAGLTFVGDTKGRGGVGNAGRKGGRILPTSQTGRICGGSVTKGIEAEGAVGVPEMQDGLHVVTGSSYERMVSIVGTTETGSLGGLEKITEESRIWDFSLEEGAVERYEVNGVTGPRLTEFFANIPFGIGFAGINNFGSDACVVWTTRLAISVAFKGSTFPESDFLIIV